MPRRRASSQDDVRAGSIPTRLGHPADAESRKRRSGRGRRPRACLSPVARMARFGVRSGSLAFARVRSLRPKPLQTASLSERARTGANGRSHLPCRRSRVRVPSSALRSTCKSAGSVVLTVNGLKAAWQGSFTSTRATTSQVHLDVVGLPVEAGAGKSRKSRESLARLLMNGRGSAGRESFRRHRAVGVYRRSCTEQAAWQGRFTSYSSA